MEDESYEVIDEVATDNGDSDLDFYVETFAVESVAPVAVNDEIYAASTDESVLIDVLANDISPDGDPLLILSVGTPTSLTHDPAGTVEIEYSAVNDRQMIRYTPDPLNKSTVTFDYTIGYAGVDYGDEANDYLTDTATVTVYITTVNSIPVVTLEGLEEIDDGVLGYIIDEVNNVVEDDPLIIFFTIWDEDAIDVSDDEEFTIQITSDNENIFQSGDYTLELVSLSGDSRTAVYKLTWIPVQHANTEKYGGVNITIKVTDGEGAFDSVTVPVVVRSVATPPVAVDDEVSVDSTADSILIDVLLNDISPDGPGLVILTVGTLTSLGMEPAGSVAIEGGMIRYTPNPRNRSTVTFEYTIGYEGIDYDDEANAYLTDKAMVTVSTIPVNFVPVITPEGMTEIENGVWGYVIEEDEEEGLVFTFKIKDIDIADIMSDLSISVSSDNQRIFTNGEMTLSGPIYISDDEVRFTVTWRPEPFANTSEEYGDVNIIITAEDEHGDSSTYTIPIIVLPVNNDPKITIHPDVEWRMNEDDVGGPTYFTFRVYDVDIYNPSSDPLDEFSVLITTPSSNHSVLTNEGIKIVSAEWLDDGKTVEFTIRFYPEQYQNTSPDLDPAVSGIMINISVTDKEGGSDEISKELIIDPVNNAPVARNYNLTSYEHQAVTIPIGADWRDVDIATNGDRVYVVLPDGEGYILWPGGGTITTSRGGTVELVGPNDGVSTATFLRYTPYGHYNGPDSFTYTIIDVGGLTSIGTVTLNIIHVNDAPIFVDLPATYTCVEAHPSGVDPITGLLRPTEVRITFRVDDVESPPESLMVQALSLDTSKILRAIIVHEPDDPPDQRTLVLTLVPYQNSTKGNPDTGGAIPIRLVVTDSEDTTTQYINITITPVNDSPVARAATFYYDEDNITFGDDDRTHLVIDIWDLIDGYCSDVDILTDDDVISFVETLLTQPMNLSGVREGDIVLTPGAGKNGLGTLTYYPKPDSENTVRFTYTVQDKEGLTATATITLNCIPVNDPPRMEPIIPPGGASFFEVNEDESITIPLRFYDPETPNDRLIIVLASSDPSIANHNSKEVTNITATGADIIIKPLPDKNTGISGPPITVTVTISDGVNSVSETFLLRVNPMPDPPAAVPDNYTVRAGNTLTFNPMDNDYDVDDGDIISMYIISQPSPDQGVLYDLGGGRFAFVADEDYVGTVVLTYYIIDDSGYDAVDKAIYSDANRVNRIWPIDANGDEVKDRDGEIPIGLLSNEGIITINVTPQSTGPSLRAIPRSITYVGMVFSPFPPLTIRNIPEGERYNLSVVSSNPGVVAVMDIAGQGSEARELTSTGTASHTQLMRLTPRTPGETLITVTLEYNGIIDAISFYLTVSDENTPPWTIPMSDVINEGNGDKYFDVLKENCFDLESPDTLKIMEILPANTNGYIELYDPKDDDPESTIAPYYRLAPGIPPPATMGYHATVSVGTSGGVQQIRYQVVGSNYSQLYWNGTDEIFYRIEDSGGLSAIGVLNIKRVPLDNAPIIYHRVYYVENDGNATEANKDGLGVGATFAPMDNAVDWDDNYGDYTPGKTGNPPEKDSLRLMYVTPSGEGPEWEVDLSGAFSYNYVSSITGNDNYISGQNTFDFPAGATPGWYTYSYRAQDYGWSETWQASNTNTIWVGVKDINGIVPPRVTSRGTFEFYEDTRIFRAGAGTPFRDNARGSIHVGAPYILYPHEDAVIRNFRLEVEVIRITRATTTVFNEANNRYETIDIDISKLIDFSAFGLGEDGKPLVPFGINIVNAAGETKPGDGDEDELGDGDEPPPDSFDSFTTFEFYAQEGAHGSIVFEWRAVVKYDILKDGVWVPESTYSSNTATDSIRIIHVNHPPELTIDFDALDDFNDSNTIPKFRNFTVVDPATALALREARVAEFPETAFIGTVDLTIEVERSDTARIPLYFEDIDIDFNKWGEVIYNLTFSWMNTERVNIPADTTINIYRDLVNYPTDNHRWILEVKPIRSEQHEDLNPAYITVTLSDGFETDAVTIEVYVKNKNTPPAARNLSVETFEDAPLSIQVVIAHGGDHEVSDIDRDELTILITNTWQQSGLQPATAPGGVWEDSLGGFWPRELGLFQMQLIDGEWKEVRVGPERGTISAMGRNIVFRPAENYNNWDPDTGAWTDTPLLIYYMLHDGLAYSQTHSVYGGYDVGVIEVKVIAVNDPPEIYGLLASYRMTGDQNYVITFRVRDVDGDKLDIYELLDANEPDTIGNRVYTLFSVDWSGFDEYIEYAEVRSVVLLDPVENTYICELHVLNKQYKYSADTDPPIKITITLTDGILIENEIGELELEFKTEASLLLTIIPVNNGMVVRGKEDQRSRGVGEADLQDVVVFGQDAIGNDILLFTFEHFEGMPFSIDFDDYFRDIDGDDIKIIQIGAFTHGSRPVSNSFTEITFTPTAFYNSFERWIGDVLVRDWNNDYENPEYYIHDILDPDSPYYGDSLNRYDWMIDGSRYAWMTLTLSDDYGASQTVMIRLQLNPVNDAPAARDFSVSMYEDGGQGGNKLDKRPLIIEPMLSSRVSDIDNMLHEIDLVAVGGRWYNSTTDSNGNIVFETQPRNIYGELVRGGTVTWNPNSRTFEYVPAPDWHGTDTVTYTVRDLEGKTDTATISIVVTSIHDDPRIAFEFNENGYYRWDNSTSFNIPSKPDDVLFWEFEEDNDGVFLIRIWTPELVNPLLRIIPYEINDIPYSNIITYDGVKFSGSGEYRTVTLTPIPNQFGVFGLIFEVNDGVAPVVRRYLTVTVHPINDLPIITGTSSYTIDENTPYTGNTYVTGTLRATDVETAPDDMWYSINTHPANGTLTLNSQTLPGANVPGAARELSWTYVPNLHWYGVETFVIQVEDDNGITGLSFNNYGDYKFDVWPERVNGITRITITVIVKPINDPPTAPLNLRLDKSQYGGGHTAILSFTAGTDKSNETPREDLVYEIEVSYNGGLTWTSLETDWQSDDDDEIESFEYTYEFVVASANTVGMLVRVRTHDDGHHNGFDGNDGHPYVEMIPLYSAWSTTPASRVDSTAPVATVALDPLASVWTNAPVTITLTLTDLVTGFSGVSEVTYTDPRITDVDVIGTGGVYKFSVPENGIYSFRLWDNVGNYRDTSVEIEHIDRLAPIIAIKSNSIDDDEPGKVEGDVVDKIKITLEYTDADPTTVDGQSGIAITQYMLSSVQATPTSLTPGWITYTDGVPFYLSIHGVWHVYARTMDNAGNDTIVYSGEYLIHNTPPVAHDVNVTVYEHTVDATRQNTVGITLNATDADSDDLIYTITGWSYDTVDGALSVGGGTIPADHFGGATTEYLLTHGDLAFGTLTKVANDQYTFTHSGEGSPPFANTIYFTYTAWDDEDYSNVAKTIVTVIEVNDPPTVPVSMISPANGTYYRGGQDIVFSWGAGSDEETATHLLRYRVYVSYNGGAHVLLSTSTDLNYTYTCPMLGDYSSIQFFVETLDTGIPGVGTTGEEAWCGERTSAKVSTNIYKLDNTPPTISAAQSPTTDTRFDVTITLTVADPDTGASGSGIASVVSDQGLTPGIGAGYTFIAEVNGTYTFTATDNMGHESTTSITITNIDKLPPKPITYIASDTEGSSEYPITVTLTYDDADATTEYKKSGVVTSQYVLIRSDIVAPATPTSLSVTWADYGSGPVTITTRGVWYLYGRAVDNAGNETITYLGVYTMFSTPYVAEDKSITVYEHTIDATRTNSSSFTLTATGAENDSPSFSIIGWYYDTVAAGGTNAGSGTGTVTPFGSLVRGAGDEYTFTHNGNGAPPFANKIYFTYVAHDSFEYSEPATITITVIEVNDPPTAPTNMISPASGTFFRGGQFITFSWTAGTDEETATSDLRYNVYVSYEGGTHELLATTTSLNYTYTCPIAEEYDSIQFFVETLDTGVPGSDPWCDELASAKAATNIYKLDNTPPTVAITQTPTADTRDNVTITLIVSDTGRPGASGIASVVSDQGLTQGTGHTFIAATNGTYSFTVTDNAGNVTNESITVANIDKLPPKPVVAINSGGYTEWGGYEITKEISVTLEYEDDDSMPLLYNSTGIATSQYILVRSDDAAPATPVSSDSRWANYTVPVEITTRGVWYLYARAVDNVGNETITFCGKYTITIDPDYSYPATLTVRKDDAEWDWGSDGKTFILKFSTNESIEVVVASDGTADIVSGTWKIYDGAVYTGTDLVIYGDHASAVLDYYTVTFDAVPAGVATGADISASNGMSSGDALLKGTTVTLTASGVGALHYSYLWNTIIGETTQDLTMTVINTVNVVCTVSGTFDPTVIINRDGELWGGRRVELYLDTTKVATMLETGLLTGEYEAELLHGVYAIYVDGINTGETLTVSEVNTGITLDFYTLTLVRGNGINTVTGNGVYLEGAEVNISATLHSGFRWIHWEDDSGTPGVGDLFERTTAITMPDHALVLTATSFFPPSGLGDARQPTYSVTVIVRRIDSGKVSPINDVDVELFRGLIQINDGQTDLSGSIVFTDVPAGNYTLVLSSILLPLPTTKSSELRVYSDITVIYTITEQESGKGNLYSKFSRDERVRVDNEDLHNVYATASADGNTDDKLGVTVYDMAIYEAGGDITIFLLANEVDEITQEDWIVFERQ